MNGAYITGRGKLNIWQRLSVVGDDRRLPLKHSLTILLHSISLNLRLVARLGNGYDCHSPVSFITTKLSGFRPQSTRPRVNFF